MSAWNRHRGVCEPLSPTEAVLPGSNRQIHFHSHYHYHYHSNNYSHYYYKLDLLKQIKQLPPQRREAHNLTQPSRYFSNRELPLAQDKTAVIVRNIPYSMYSAQGVDALIGPGLFLT